MTYLYQIILGILALAALLKDWKDYASLSKSKRLRSIVPGVLAILTIVVTFLAIRETYRSNITEAKSASTIDGLSKQVQQLRSENEKDADGFRSSFSGLYDRFSALQSKVQNQDLLREIEQTKRELIATRSKLSQPKAIPVATFPFRDIKQVPVTTTTASRGSEKFITLQFLIYNPSDVNATDGSLMLRICDLCEYADEPQGFVKVTNGNPRDREFDFRDIWAKSLMAPLSAHIIIPPTVSSFEIRVWINCQTCSTGTPQLLNVFLQ